MLVNRPRRQIAKVGNYDISVSSDSQLEDSVKFDNFCAEFKTVLVAMFNKAKADAAPTPKEATS